MTSKAKEALEELNFNFHYEVPFFVASIASPRISDKGMNTIIRALTILAAIDFQLEISKSIAPGDEFQRGYDACLAHLKNIGEKS